MIIYYTIMLFHLLDECQNLFVHNQQENEDY